MDGLIAFLKKITVDDVRGVLLVKQYHVIWANRQATQILPDWSVFEALYAENEQCTKSKWENVAIADSMYEVERYVLDASYSIITLVDQMKYNGLYRKLGSYNPFVILESVLNASYDGVYIADSETTVIMVSDSYERVTGINKAELIGKNMTQIVDEGHFNWSVSLQAAQQRRTVSGWVVVSGKDILTTAVPIFRNNDPEDDIIMIIANVRSVPELSKLLEEMRKEYSYVNEKERSELEILRAKDSVLENLIAKDKNTLATIEKGLRVAKFDSNVLLTGETGVGKSEIARLIHNNSNRATERLVEINCGAIPESLIESELFGYEKGAFTGADTKGKQGFFGLANRGTIFLDEVGELPLNMQVKLLQVIQEKVMYRIGNSNPIHVDVRIIAATNRDLPALMAEGKFRTDLYYRLAVGVIPIPPLRERKDDISP
ncbi:MAG: sigma 54-interacting transcriptional regulator [Desulfosporosinus sp.]|nr:sigma 54-interacting transcriptional regulator [Desulfosporosinus sp.]